MDQHLAQLGSNVMLKRHDGVDAMVVCASKAPPGIGRGGVPSPSASQPERGEEEERGWDSSTALLGFGVTQRDPRL